MDNLKLLLLILLLGPPSNASFQRALVLEMANILLDNYCYPESLVGMQEAIQQAINSGEILQISDKKTLASVLTAGVQGALNDPRLTVSYEPNYVPVTPAILPSLPRDQLIRLVRNSVKLDIFENNVGYLRMDRIIGEGTAAKLGSLLKDNIWNAIARASSLILDLRYSTAGDLSGVPFIISFFSEPTPLIHIDTVYDRPSNTTTELWTEPVIKTERFGKDKDLIILTSKRTTGAAEAVAFTLKQLKRAVTVGERTAGGSVKVRKIRIARSEFYITVPVARFLNPKAGQGWEVSGVPPTVTITAKEAVAKARSVLAVRRIIPHVLRHISEKIQRFYAFTDRVPVILQRLQQRDIFSAVSEEDLAATINQELQTATEDPRLIVKLTKMSPTNADEEHVSYKVPNDPKLLEEIVDSTFKVELLPGNTGYLRFDRFLRWPARGKLDELLAKKVWEPLKDTENLVIDLRHNTGGPSSSLAILLSYLHDASPKRTFYTSYDRIRNTTTEHGSTTKITGPVYGSKRGIYVLTSYFTARTGEEFAYLMQSLHRGTVVGEITSGNLKQSTTFQIEGTDFALTVPYINFLDNNGEFWPGGGVVPDAIILADEAVEYAQEIADFHRGIRLLVEGAGQLLEEHYAIQEVALNVSKTLLNKWAEGFYRSVVDVESLTSQLTADLQETSGDHRLHVFHCDVVPEKVHETPQIPPADEVEYFITALFKVDILPGNIGYLRFDMMADIKVVQAIGPQLVTLVWTKVVNTDTLIIDMRYNTGGFSTAVPLLCTYFFDPGDLQHLYTIYDHARRTTTEVKTYPHITGQRFGSAKDVYILTSHMTGSAAELFTQTMKDLNRATVIGEPTNGGSLSSDTYQIQDSDLYVSIPNQVVLSATTRTMWSLAGVEPDVNAQASNALTVAQRIIAAKMLKRRNLPATFPPTLITDMAKIVMDNYCSPEKLIGMKEAINAAGENTEVLNIPDGVSLASVLNAGFQTTVSDHRLKISYEPNYVPAVAPKMPPLPPEQLVAVIQTSIKLDILDGNIGYLRIDHIMGEEVAEKIGNLLVDLVWSKILPTSALIFDLRYTGSGDISGLPYIVSYFTDPEPVLHIDSVYDRPTNTTTKLMSMSTLLAERYGISKPLIILTSKNTKGVAEDVAYCLQNLKRASIVGEKTAGGSVKVDTFRVGVSDFYVTIPTAKSINPITGSTWEVTGVSPDVAVHAEDALATAIKIVNLRAQVPAIIEGSAILISEKYAFEDIGSMVASKLKGLLADGKYSLVVSKTELEEKLSADLKHLSGDKSLKTSSNVPALPPLNYTPEMYIDLIKVSFTTDILENNIGYLRFDMFGDFEEVKAIAQIIVEHVWNKVVNSDAMIVDLRNNLGGPTTAIAGFCSYFFDADKQILLDKLYDRPSGTYIELKTLPHLTGARYGSKKSLIILTSHATAGAAEEFVYIMKKLGRAMIVGETTAGASHPPVTFPVGDTNVFLSIPTIHSDTAAGPAWEGAGIAPHIPVSAEAALETAKGIFYKHIASPK
ncbi:retinol-binding protein 3 [Neosynchiropus ocellatus]